MKKLVIESLDVAIRDFIVWLNENNIKTSFSCSGHFGGFRPEGNIVFKSVEDCNKFKSLSEGTGVFNRIGHGDYGHSRRVLYFEFSKDASDNEILSLWKDLFCKVAYNKFLMEVPDEEVSA